MKRSAAWHAPCIVDGRRPGGTGARAAGRRGAAHGCAREPHSGRPPDHPRLAAKHGNNYLAAVGGAGSPEMPPAGDHSHARATARPTKHMGRPPPPHLHDCVFQVLGVLRCGWLSSAAVPRERCRACHKRDDDALGRCRFSLELGVCGVPCTRAVGLLQHQPPGLPLPNAPACLRKCIAGKLDDTPECTHPCAAAELRPRAAVKPVFRMALAEARQQVARALEALRLDNAELSAALAAERAC